MIVDHLLGRGVIGVYMKESSCLFATADYGGKAEDEVFLLWKQKLMKHEQTVRMMANYEFRNEKRIKKQHES